MFCYTQHITLGVLLSFSHQSQDGLGVLERLGFTRCSGVLSIVSQFLAATEVTDRVTVRFWEPTSKGHDSLGCQLNKKDDEVPQIGRAHV